MSTKQQAITTKVLDVQEHGVLELVVNSGSADRVGEILDLNGLDVTKYLENPVVGWGHDYSQPAIGKTLKLWRDETTGYLRALVKFAVEQYDFAKLIYDLYKDGYMTAWSIGFIPKEAQENDDGTLTFTKSEMLEYSAVFVGADSRALTQAKSIGGDKFVKALEGKITVKDFESKDNTPIAEVKEGRVLSKSNRNKVQSALDALQNVLDADLKDKDGAKSVQPEIEAPLETAEKTIIGIRRLVYSSQADPMAIKKQAQALHKSAEELLRQTKQASGKANVKKVIYRKG